MDAIKKARAANAPTARERDWIEAVAQFYEGYDTVDQKTRTARYERAMRTVHQALSGRCRDRCVLRSRAQ